MCLLKSVFTTRNASGSTLTLDSEEKNDNTAAASPTQSALLTYMLVYVSALDRLRQQIINIIAGRARGWEGECMLSVRADASPIEILDTTAV